VDAAALYEDLCQELIGIVRSASEDDLDLTVAASPVWRVRDVLSRAVRADTDDAATGGQRDRPRRRRTGLSGGSLDLIGSAEHRCRPARGVVWQTGRMIRALLVALVVLLVATFPATWLLMLFFGNLGVGLSYWGTLPLGILVSALLGGAGAGSYRV
jgi:hypothetical protein